ncbi:hypothetical protein XENOCAPTIV_017065 [Xenoophorus captivus]|uniref:Transposase n=1 Tax=Xenoophorus captivus TaxID=1517983 RepID=A0ABV0Q5C4_9TELE
MDKTFFKGEHPLLENEHQANSQTSLAENLEENLQPSVPELQHRAMQWDNDSKHTSKSTSERCKNKGKHKMKVLERPCYSPDRNPLKCCGRTLNRLLKAKYLYTFSGPTAFSHSVRLVWIAFPLIKEVFMQQLLLMLLLPLYDRKTCLMI